MRFATVALVTGLSAATASAAALDDLAGTWVASLSGGVVEKVVIDKTPDGKPVVAIGFFDSDGTKLGGSLNSDRADRLRTSTVVGDAVKFELSVKSRPEYLHAPKIGYTLRVQGGKLVAALSPPVDRQYRKLQFDAQVPPAAPTAPVPGEEFAGTWRGRTPRPKLDEVWTVHEFNGSMVVAGTYEQDGKPVGSFTAADIQVADGKLAFTQQVVQAPERGWPASLKVEAALDSGRTLIRADLTRPDKKKGTRALDRVAPPPEKTPVKADLAGTWARRLGGTRSELSELWVVAKTRDGYRVTGELRDGNKVKAKYEGVEVRLQGESLFFTWIDPATRKTLRDVVLTTTSPRNAYFKTREAGGGAEVGEGKLGVVLAN